MNILIESGATKSTCIGYNGACIFFTDKISGINATYATKEFINEIFQEFIVKNNIDTAEVKNLRYYGAGCFHAALAEKVKEVLCVLFPKTIIEVFSDLYAPCHALCKKDKGFVGILGTGAASCFYNGTIITDKAPSLGFFLGDEGSGVHLGKLFVTKYLKELIDYDIVQDFEETFLISKQTIFEKMCQEPKPQTFFASIPVFLNRHRRNEQINAIIENSFQEFFDQQKDYYSTFQYPWYFCGSIAYHFQDILNEIAQKNNIKIEKIVAECAPLLLNFDFA